MSRKKSGIWSFFSSVQLAIVLLSLIAFFALVGTIVPQREAAVELGARIWPGLFSFLQKIQIFDLYHSVWFFLLMVLLSVNLIICSLDRFPLAWRRFRTQPSPWSEEVWKNISPNDKFQTKADLQQAADKAERLFKKKYRTGIRGDASGEIYLCARKGRFSLFGVYIVHLSILILIAGALIGSFFDMEAFVNITEGETAESVFMRGGERMELPFSVRCDKFTLEFYENGAPKIFQSDLTFLKEGRPVHAGELRVIDTTTGASALVGAFPGGVEVDSFAFATGGTADVPWLFEDPASGTVPAEDDLIVDVFFNPTGGGLSQPGDYLAELKINHDTPYTYANIPVTLHLLAPEYYGTFNGTVYGLEACDVNPTALAGATVNFWQEDVLVATTTTLGNGNYNYSLSEGTYDIEILMDGFVDQIAYNFPVEGGETVTVDFELRLDMPCLSVDPASLEQWLMVDRTADQTLTLVNNGAGEAVFEIIEMAVAGIQETVELVLDDGTRDNNIGIGGTWEMIWVNRFTPDPDAYPFNLEQVQIWFSSVGEVYVGDDIIIVVYENTTGNIDPAVGSNWLYSYPTTVQALDTWSVYDLPEVVELNGPGDVVIGVIALEVPGGSYWPASIDQTTTQQRSWAGWWLSSPPPNPPVLPPDDTWILIDDYFPGNWMVRGYGETAAEDIVWLSEDPISGTVPGDSAVDVTVTFDSTGLALGDYFAKLWLKNPPAPAIKVPVTLHVMETITRYLWLPIILK